MQPITFQLPHLTLHGLSNGNEKAPVLLCLHGWLDNAASFEPLSQYLSKYHVIALDLAGHGFSDHRSADAYYHFVDWLSDLLALFEQQQWQALDIVAHSMGAMIASAFAAALPERVKSLTLIDSIGFITTPVSDTCQQLREGILSRAKLPYRNKRYHETLDSAVQARIKVSDLSYDNAKHIVKRSLQESEHGFSWRYDRKLQLVSPYRFSEAQAIELIKHIRCRCLLIYGNSGENFVKAAIAIYQPLFQDMSSHHLVGGHHIHMEEPEQVAQLIENFLRNFLLSDGSISKY